MKHPNKILAAALLIAGFNLLSMTGCVGGGYVDAGGGSAYYGDGPWIDSTVIVGGRGWYGGHRDNAYVHPDNHPAPRGNVHVEAHSAPSHDDHHR
ncbi:MAG TPA: hypothetical protein VIJ19_09010 [Opitutaceae bacterium]